MKRGCVRKRGARFEATFRYEAGEVDLGLFDCRACAERAREVASRCVETAFTRQPTHGHLPCAIRDAQELGIKEAIENHFGFELSEERAMRESDKLEESFIEYRISKALAKESADAMKRNEVYKSKRLLRTVPLVDVEYPKIPIASVPATELGEGVPESSGVYFVWDFDSVVYVGQSVNLHNRVRLRHEKICVGDRVSWLEFPLSVLNFAEAFYIGIACPSRNFGEHQRKHETRQSAET